MEILAALSTFLKVSLLTAWLPVFVIGLLVERVAPAERAQPFGHVILNVGYAIVSAMVLYLLTPVTAALSIAVVNLCGGGFFRLPDDGWTIVGSAALFIIAMDFMEYIFHRAQHSIPFLWAMHSLHHSDPSVNVTTTTRAFWLEPAIKAIFLYPLVGILFQVPPTIYAIYSVARLYNFVDHLNLRIHLGRCWMLLNGPQYHRIHHSTRPEHFNRNFAAFFPIFDVIFGTAHRPLPGEFPTTGLDNRDPPRNVQAAMVWPFRWRQSGIMARR
jgi:sterol desaturase/sphingolipid hydroxylase (fatty acid hydroxylase superfamily)